MDPEANRAQNVTWALTLCLRDAAGNPIPEFRIWEASVPWRLQGLLAVACATQGPVLAAAGVCAHGECGEPLEFEMDLTGFAEVPTAGRLDWESEGTSLVLRLPTGMDQWSWSQNPAWGEAAMATALVEAVNGNRPDTDWGFPESWLEGLATRMEKADPLTSLQVDIACPHCERTSRVDVDLEELLILRLLRERKSLLRQVFTLAAAFHWPEADILGLPPRRRAHYLNLLSEA